jgi:hypothetical protein
MPESTLPRPPWDTTYHQHTERLLCGDTGWDVLTEDDVEHLLTACVVGDDRLDPAHTATALATRRFLDALADEDDDYLAGGGPEWWEQDPADWPAEYEGLEVAA